MYNSYKARRNLNYVSIGVVEVAIHVLGCPVAPANQRRRRRPLPAQAASVQLSIHHSLQVNQRVGPSVGVPIHPKSE